MMARDTFLCCTGGRRGRERPQWAPGDRPGCRDRPCPACRCLRRREQPAPCGRGHGLPDRRGLRPVHAIPRSAELARPEQRGAVREDAGEPCRVPGARIGLPHLSALAPPWGPAHHGGAAEDHPADAEVHRVHACAGDSGLPGLGRELPGHHRAHQPAGQGDLDPRSPRFQAARQACQKYMREAGKYIPPG